jgi:hypothetical protein
MKKLLTALLLLSLIYTQGLAQKRTPPTVKKPAPKQKTIDSKLDAYPFALPIEVRIGYHRMTDPAMFLTLKNLGSRLSIKSVSLAVFVADPIRLKILKTYSQTFKFAVPIKPKDTEESVATSEDGFNVSSADLVPARCKDYKADKDDPTRFMPDSCIQGQDFLMVMIVGIDYTDGSKWVTAKLTDNK